MPSPSDRTNADLATGYAVAPDADGQPRIVDLWVEGQFDLDESDRDILGVSHTSVMLRRRFSIGEKALYEWQVAAPEDPALRGLDELKLQELKDIAAQFGIAASGNANQKSSWLEPLSAHVSTLPSVTAWVPIPAALQALLPQLVMFSSTEEPDPQTQVQSALRASFDLLMADDTIIGPVRETEATVRRRLSADAEKLCGHIATRVPELDSITAVPDISFREGFSGVTLAPRRGGGPVTLGGIGAGSQRRITLAVWEWVSELLKDSSRPSTIIVYDEPDTHLDYERQREFMALIRSQCSNGSVRMLIATHSMNLIDGVDITDVVHLRLRDHLTIVDTVLEDTHEDADLYLGQIATALGLRTSVYLHERCFLAVEGPTEAATLPILFKIAMGAHLQTHGIAILNCSSNDAALRFVRFLTDRDRLVCMLIDRDSQSNDATRKIFSDDKIRALGIPRDRVIFVGRPNEFEELFSDDQWANAAERHWPRDDGAHWDARSFLDHRNPATKFSDAILGMIRIASSNAPTGKPDLNMGMAQTIASPDDVPRELRDAFAHIVALAQA